MELVLFLCAGMVFALLPAGAPLVLRCGLYACLRFSPRAAAALSSLASCFACLFMLLIRRGHRVIPLKMFPPLIIPSIVGGTIGRAALLMFVARFSGSQSLAQLQTVPLLMLTLVFVAYAGRRRFATPKGTFSLSMFSCFCAAVDGFFGAGGAALFSLVDEDGVLRKRHAPSSPSLLCGLTAQLSALLLTLLSQSAQVFPIRALICLAAGTSVGVWAFEHTQKRSALHVGMRTALLTYLVFAALAGVEQAFL